MTNTFAERLKKIREEKGFSQRELAKKIGITSTQISYFENEITTPRLVTLEWLCEALGVSATELLGY